MKTIYQLQQIADRLRAATEVNSISPEDTFGLQSDILEYMADMEQNAEGLGIHKVYASYAAMVADASAPVGSNGKALRFGQLVVIYNSSNTTQAESGNVYAWQKGNTGAAAWLLMGNLGSVYALQSQIDSLLSSLADEESARTSADNNLSSRINTLQSENTNRKSEIQTLQSENTSRKAAIEALQTQLNTLLDGNVDETIESFNEVVSFLAGVKDEETLTALLQSLNDRITSSEIACSHTLRFVAFNGFVHDVETSMVSVVSWDAVVYDTDSDSFLALQNIDGGARYCNGWGGKGDYYTTEEDGAMIEIREDRIFIDTSTGDAYRGNAGGGAISAIGVTHQELEELAARITALEILAADELDEVIPVRSWISTTDGPLQNMQVLLNEGEYSYDPRLKKLYKGVAITTPQGQIYVSSVEVTPSTKKLYLDITNCLPYIWKGGDMVAIAPKETPASIFNATTAVPIRGYYVLCDAENESMSAVHAAWKEEKAVSGLIISFEMSAGIWKTYQYVGKTVTQANWLDPENWKDFGSLAAGSETYLVIDELCGTPTGGAYTLGSAVDALIAYQTKTGVSYAKKGLIISYKTGQNEMETKQFQGEVSDFNEVGLWKDFGGGKVETKDATEKDGKDALSTGGAHNLIPANLHIDTETEGVVKVSMVNAEGDTVGDEQQFTVGTGSGGGSGTIIGVQWKENPLYEKAGGTFVAKASIISVTKVGSMDNYNSIMKVQFINRTTKKTVATFEPKKPSSGSNEDYSFEFDLSTLGASAGEIPLQAVVTDDGGNTATKNISLIAVDVTCVSVQTLNYTKDTSLEVSGNAKSIPMFKFPNNASDKGILTTVEIYKDGDWRQLQTETVTDTYSHRVLIDPAGLSHGAYAIRIQGEDVSSGVKGNVLYCCPLNMQSQFEPIVVQ